MWRGVSPSRMPLRSLPTLSRAVYSKAPMVVYWLKAACGAFSGTRPGCLIFTRDSQDLLERGLAAQHAGAAVVADGRGALARVAFDLVLGRPVMDHVAHPVVDYDQLIDAGAAAVAAARIAPRTIEGGRGVVGVQVQELALALAGFERLLAVGTEHAHQALRQHPDQRGGQQERLDPHVAQAGDGARRGIGVERRHHQVAGE